MTAVRRESFMMLRAFRVGAAAWVFTGVLHDVLELALARDPGVEAALREASSIEIGALSLKPALLTSGVSLAMGVAMILVGVLLWMLGDLLRDAPEKLARFAIVALVGSAAVLVLAVLHLLGPPILTFTVATIAFAVTVGQVWRSAHEGQTPSARAHGPSVE